jgi:hypothetical protein
MDSKLRSAPTLREDKEDWLRRMEAAGLGESQLANQLRRELWPDPGTRPETTPVKVFFQVEGPSRPQ